MEETLIHGVTPATEILTSEHAQLVVDALLRAGPEAQILVWLGARNQNHLEQTKISKILAEGPSGIHFMFKNQMWDDERHWMGIYEHIVSAGFPKERLLMCHRGFCPGKMPNPKGYRNLPDFEMAMRMKQKTGLPMILDPSHIGGTQDNVFDIMRQAQGYDFDGYLIEVHHDPHHALTDVKQQLSLDQFKDILSMVNA
jgi:chorismate mutase